MFARVYFFSSKLSYFFNVLIKTCKFIHKLYLHIQEKTVIGVCNGPESNFLFHTFLVILKLIWTFSLWEIYFLKTWKCFYLGESFNEKSFSLSECLSRASFLLRYTGQSASFVRADGWSWVVACYKVVKQTNSKCIKSMGCEVEGICGLHKWRLHCMR